MDDLDFYSALSDLRMTGQERAEILEKLASSAPVPKDIAPALAAGGAALAYVAQYLMNKPRGERGSVQQETWQAAQERAAQAKAREGKSPSFSTDLAESTARGAKAVSDTLARHPAKGAVLAIPMGLAAGWRVAKALKP